MAATLGISRNAIFKSVKELRGLGYSIDAASNRGYRLTGVNDILNSAEIIAYLNPKYAKIYTDFPELIKIFQSTESTNRVAKECAISSACHGTLVLSDQQTFGRGRGDHSFFSPLGGLYMSVVLSPDKLTFASADEVTEFIGNSVCKAIESLTEKKPVLKPINDIFIDGKKVCGILTEAGSEFETGRLQWIVVGIGINFNSDISSFPDEIKEKAASLFTGDAGITRNQLAAEILNRIL